MVRASAGVRNRSGPGLRPGLGLGFRVGVGARVSGRAMVRVAVRLGQVAALKGALGLSTP
jgi:hypothetical protein